ncbi:hypothetical protein Tco_0863363 [Tanacetum coccineum]
MPRLRISNATCTVTREEYTSFIDRFHIPSCYDPVLPRSHRTALDALPSYVVLYLSLFIVGNFQLPLDKIFLKVLDFFKCHISLLTPFGTVCLSSFVVACRAYGGEPTLSLFRPLWLTPFSHGLEPILYLVGLTYSWERSPIHLTILVDGHGMTLRDFFHFPRNRSVTIVVVSDSVPLSIGSPDVPAINLLDIDIKIQVSGSVDADVDLPSARKEVMVSPSCGSKGKGLSPQVVGVLPLYSWGGALDFLPGRLILSCQTQRRLDGLSLSKLANFHDVFALKFMMSSHMLNKEVRSLSVEVLRIRNEIVALRNKRADSPIVISMLEAKLLDVKGKSAPGEDFIVRDLRAENEKLVGDIASLRKLSHLAKSDIESLSSRCHQFKEKEVVMLATKASIKAELEVLKEKLTLLMRTVH